MPYHNLSTEKVHLFRMLYFRNFNRFFFISRKEKKQQTKNQILIIFDVRNKKKLIKFIFILNLKKLRGEDLLTIEKVVFLDIIKTRFSMAHTGLLYAQYLMVDRTK